MVRAPGAVGVAADVDGEAGDRKTSRWSPGPSRLDDDRERALAGSGVST
jgi:hypothetical protein